MFKRTFAWMLCAFLLSAIAAPAHSQRGASPPQPPPTSPGPRPQKPPHGPQNPKPPNGPRPPRPPHGPRPPHYPRPPYFPHGPHMPLPPHRSNYFPYQPRTVFLGVATVDDHMEHDTVFVGRTSVAVRAIQLHASGGPVELRRVIVRYVGGASEMFHVHATILPGGHSRPITLSDHRNGIESVDLWYGNSSRHRHPVVTVYGIW
jgi:hypothetical protein